MTATALRSLAFLIVVPGLVGGYVPLNLAPMGPRLETGLLAYAAFPLWAAASIIVLSSFWEFLARGRGTPAPFDAPRALVVSGFYRYVRNPMYVGLVMALAGYTLWFGALSLLLYALFVAAAVHAFVVLYEEPILRGKFGAPYEQYLQSVPRWWPRRA